MNSSLLFPTFGLINCSSYVSEVNFNNSFTGNPNKIPWLCLRYPFHVEQILIFLFGFLFIATLGGNCLVILAIILVRKLQIPSNYLILSLAASDALVAFVLPLAAFVQMLGGHWPFSETLCDIFLSLDVLLCSSSILNLCAISIDRYLIITRPLRYGSRRTLKQMLLMIFTVWLLSGLISIPPAIGWKEKFKPGICIYSENLGYQIFATFGAFYIPLIIMLVLYGRIFMLTRSMVKRDAVFKTRSSNMDLMNIENYNTNNTNNNDNNNNNSQPFELREVSLIRENYHLSLSENSLTADTLSLKARPLSATNSPWKRGKLLFSKPPLLSKRDKNVAAENKAITTLGVIMGCFTLCWLPFFVIQLLKPVLKVLNIKGDKFISQWIQDMFLWLGYINSFLNPIIYAKFNREFRTPFKLILLCRCMNINAAIRSETYAEQCGPRTPTHLSGPRQRIKSTLGSQHHHHISGVTTTHNHQDDVCLSVPVTPTHLRLQR